MSNRRIIVKQIKWTPVDLPDSAGNICTGRLGPLEFMIKKESVAADVFTYSAWANYAAVVKNIYADDISILKKHCQRSVERLFLSCLN